MHRRAAHDLALPGFLSTPVVSFLSRPASAVEEDPFDAAAGPLHGNQEGRHRIATATCRCTSLAAALRARLRPSNGTAGTVVELPCLVERIHWPKTKIVVRDSSGFCRDDIMT